MLGLRATTILGLVLSLMSSAFARASDLTVEEFKEQLAAQGLVTREGAPPLNVQKAFGLDPQEEQRIIYIAGDLSGLDRFEANLPHAFLDGGGIRLVRMPDWICNNPFSATALIFSVSPLFAAVSSVIAGFIVSSRAGAIVSSVVIIGGTIAGIIVARLCGKQIRERNTM